MTMNKPTMPREVADAIETLRSIGFDDPAIVEFHYRARDKIGSDVGRTIYDYSTCAKNFGTLLAALVNGYDVEKTAEELAHERIRDLYASKRQDAEKYRWTSFTEYSRESGGFADGVVYTLDTLGVKITGVNA